MSSKLTSKMNDIRYRLQAGLKKDTNRKKGVIRISEVAPCFTP